MIGPDGKSIKLRGPFDDVPVKDGGKSTDPKKALAALIATRDARTSSVGLYDLVPQMLIHLTLLPLTLQEVDRAAWTKGRNLNFGDPTQQMSNLL